MKKWTLTVDGIFPTANTYMRMHWGLQGTHKSSWFWYLAQAMGRSGAGPDLILAKKKRHVKVISYRRGDPDEHNLVLCADKLVLDNLIKHGVLVDDNKKWCKLKVKGEKAGKRGLRTVIEITER